MTAFNMAPFRQVIIHGDCWPVVNTVEYLTRSVLPGCNCEKTYTLPVLLQHLYLKPDAILVLCLRPRDHLFLFYALRTAMPEHPVIVISDELFFSDLLVLKVYGGIPVLLEQELEEILIRTRRGEVWYDGPARPRMMQKLDGFLLYPAPVTGFLEVPLIFNSPKKLMNYMSQLIHREMLTYGVNSAELRLLREVYKGRCTLSGLSEKLKTKERQIWQDKNRLLVKLGMKNRMRELLSGTRFCMDTQKTTFMSPAKIRIFMNG